MKVAVRTTYREILTKIIVIRRLALYSIGLVRLWGNWTNSFSSGRWARTIRLSDSYTMFHNFAGFCLPFFFFPTLFFHRKAAFSISSPDYFS